MSSSALQRRPVGASEAAETRGGFGDLDTLLDDARSLSGVIVLRAPAESRSPLLAHVGRRLRAAGWMTIEVTPRAPCSAFREAGIQLGIDTLPCEANEYASALARACAEAPTGQQGRRAALLMPLPARGSWDEAVALELSGHAEVLLVFTAMPSTPAPASATAIFDVGEDLTGPEKGRWFAAMAYEAESLVRTSKLRNLEEWWQSTTRQRAESLARGHALSHDAARLLGCLALVRRSIPLAALEHGLVEGVLLELARAGLILPRANVLVLDPALDLGALERETAADAKKLALDTLLGGAFDGDPWALARAAELLVADGRALEGDATIEQALRRARDGRIAAEISDRWFEAVAHVSGETGLEIRLRAAERALAGGNAHDAQRWCESAAGANPTNPRVRLAMARAQAQTGDLVAARVVLEQLAETAATSGDHELRASILVEQAEIRYVAGHLDAAVSEAEQAIDLTTSSRTRLAARSVIGKVLLARGAWDKADAHFAADTLSAHADGDARAQLRARLNRSIVLMAKGLHAEARVTLTRVLEDGEREGEHRACALALSNLGVVAYHQRDYVGALSFWERTLRYRDALGGRLATAMPIANLAELRLRLGLVDNAEHAIVFGRSFLAGSMTPARTAHFELVSAQVALARGNGDIAFREVESAMVHARASGDVEYVGAAAIVGARVSLADGDVRRAGEWITTASTNAKTARSMAEVAMLRAMHLRALGRPALAAALAALDLARTANEEDLLVDVHALVAASARDERDRETAQLHCSRALAIRDRIAATLPPEIRAAFLAKPEMVFLERVRISLSEPRHVEVEVSPPRTPRLEGRRSPRPELVGSSPQMRSLLLSIKKAARSESTILIHGESGTGKELVARALHETSARSNGPLVIVNCAALVETLLLSELFGHEKGAFTGATTRKRGRFELAEGGTLFLDEIGDISARTQVALLRVLQEHTFERVGGTTSIRTNVRVVCATHRDLRAMVERRELREDLYYRICGITLEVPPLRARIGDLPDIARHLLERIGAESGAAPKTLSSDAMDVLLRHSWPGNVRELENVLRSAAVFSDAATITANDLIELTDGVRRGGLHVSPRAIGPEDDAEEPAISSREDVTAAAYLEVRQGRLSLHDMKRQIERECIHRALVDAKGNITRAAAVLGMKRPRLSQLVKQYGFSVSSTEEGQ